MSNLRAIRVKNLRSFMDTEEIPIRRINLLVGRNSGGKSTFARILPLIRQSTEVRKRSPVLWYGRLVDFGSFHDSLRNTKSVKEIEISFRIDLNKKTSDLSTKVVDDELSYNISTTITLSQKNLATETTISKLEINFEAIKCVLTFDDQKLTLISVDELQEVVNPAYYQQISYPGLLPKINAYRFQKVKVGTKEVDVPTKTDLFTGALTREIASISKSNAQLDSYEELIDQLSFGSDKEILIQLKKPNEGPTRWSTFCKTLEEKNPAFVRIRNLIIMAKLPLLLATIDEAITVLSKNVSYLEPLRATAQRYYRRQDLAVDEIDSRGSNVPFFLDNLTKYEKDELNKWLAKNFGISVETESAGGHIAIRLKIAGSDRAVNLADTGFGYSQVLPIALQLWKLSAGWMFMRSGTDEFIRKTVVIEQPELHLHPALQSKLADIFVACTSDIEPQSHYQGPGIDMIVETHSPSLVNRLGELVSMGMIAPSDVQVILFEKNEETGISTTRIAEYSPDGRLKNWPHGFFDAIDDIEPSFTLQG